MYTYHHNLISILLLLHIYWNMILSQVYFPGVRYYPKCLHSFADYVQCQVGTLHGHLWSNVCSKFNENRGILKPISRNRDMGLLFT